MGMCIREWLSRLGKNSAAQVGVCAAAILVVANLSSLVDLVVHPDIPYFDEEHIVVGSVTAIVCTVLFATVMAYVRHLNRALETIKRLESLLRICCHCKRILKPECEPRSQESWQSVESYVPERTACQFTHGICPECKEEHYGDLMRAAGVELSSEATGQRFGSVSGDRQQEYTPGCDGGASGSRQRG